MIEVGKKVTWTSQAQGSDKTKTGTVIAIVPPQKDANMLLPPNVKSSHVKYGQISIYERVLVAVPAGKDGKATHYYCPRKSILEMQGN